MEFAKYYDVTNKVRKMMDRGELSEYNRNTYKGIFICMDTHDFWIARILRGYDEDYEENENSYLIERNKVDKYDFIDYINEADDKDYEADSRRKRDYVISKFSDKFIIERLMMLDEEEGLSSWDIYQCDSMEEAVAVLDDGFGIEEYIEY